MPLSRRWVWSSARRIIDQATAPSSAKVFQLTQTTAGVDYQRIEAAVREIIAAIGEDPEREGLAETPRRIAEMYGELFSGIDEDPREVLTKGFEESHKEMVVLKDVPFYSLCEHHFLPFHGKAHVGYVPEGRVVGVSKLARAVDILARRPQLQERLTSQVADAIMDGLTPDGVAVVIEAEHLCMTMRGVQKPGAVMITSAIRGGFRRRGVTRSEFLSLVRGR
jgi:GTP cyclohydrolase I